MVEADVLSGEEGKLRGAMHRAQAIRDACLCAERRETGVALAELLRIAGLRDECARLDGLGLEFRYALRRAMADEFAKRRGLDD